MEYKKIKTSQIKGKGRGKFLGFPTINMQIPDSMSIEEGIWAVWVDIQGSIYKGALHYGPIPTFGDAKKSLEVFLLDVSAHDAEKLDTSTIILRPVERLREVRSFTTQEELITQMKSDIVKTSAVLQE